MHRRSKMDNSKILIGCYRLASSATQKVPITIQSICSFVNATRYPVGKLLRSFGISGKTGLGFKHVAFKKQIESLLGLKRYRIAIVGWGKVANELINCDWLSQNYEIAALFDGTPELIGLSLNGLICDDICSLSRIIDERDIDIAIITESEGFDRISSELRKSKIRGVWNFSPMHIEMPANILVEEVFDGIMRLSFHMTGNKEKRDDQQ